MTTGDLEGVKVGVKGEKVNCSLTFVGMTEKNNIDKGTGNMVIMIHAR